MADLADIDARLDKLATYRFRAKFHLRAHERGFVELRGMETVRHHARDLIVERLAPAQPKKDGKQTPWGGHPVFVAQHATATCCRGCLEKNHGIAKGAELTPQEQDYVVEVIARWITRDLARRPGRPRAAPAQLRLEPVARGSGSSSGSRGARRLGP